ncbi:MAG: NUDIX domain-containing protein [Proteobacteria bacterium]|nr:NUDIX domain-containing protein [Pseudomonadota bacterium]
MNSEPNTPLAIQIALIADELRALCANGQHWADNSYQVERFQRIRALAAELQSLADTRPLPEIEQIFSADLAVKTPLATVDVAVIDAEERLLLIQRADNELWAMPGGACEIGDTPAQSGAREVWEETGYVVEITRLLGVFDSRHCGTINACHLYHFLFAAAPVAGEAATSAETLAIRWLELSDIPWQQLSPGHAFRIQQAMQWWLNLNTKPYFDWKPWQPAADKQRH